MLDKLSTSSSFHFLVSLCISICLVVGLLKLHLALSPNVKKTDCLCPNRVRAKINSFTDSVLWEFAFYLVYCSTSLTVTSLNFISAPMSYSCWDLAESYWRRQVQSFEHNLEWWDALPSSFELAYLVPKLSNFIVFTLILGRDQL